MIVFLIFIAAVGALVLGACYSKGLDEEEDEL